MRVAGGRNLALVDDLVKLNNLPNANVLHVGQVLKLSPSTESDNNMGVDYISRYVPVEVKQAIMKYLELEDGNHKAAIAYSRSHIALPVGSTSADIDKNKNLVHIKTTTKSVAIKKRQKPPEKHKTDKNGTAKPVSVSNEFVSRHCVSEDMYSRKNVMDISKTRLGSIGRVLDKIIKKHVKSNAEIKYISPYGHAGEPAIHIVIDQ